MKKISLRVKELNKEIEKYNISFSKKEQASLLDNKIILINDKPTFFYYQKELVPTLKFLQERPILKKISIDVNAIKFIVNGADVMRPGIKEIEAGIVQDEIIMVIDVDNKKPLAVGIALLNSEEMLAASSGKVIKNIHYVGDEIWRTI